MKARKNWGWGLFGWILFFVLPAILTYNLFKIDGVIIFALSIGALEFHLYRAEKEE